MLFRSVVATHGHEDHVGALQYLLRELSFPIYGSAVTLGLARHRIEEAGLLGRTELVTVRDGERLMIGPFDVEFIPVTHSVPYAHAIALHTPQGVVLHTGDFKLDKSHIDRRVKQLEAEGVKIRTGVVVGEWPKDSKVTNWAKETVSAEQIKKDFDEIGRAHV